VKYRHSISAAGFDLFPVLQVSSLNVNWYVAVFPDLIVVVTYSAVKS
jgi:hypothetical protein